MEDKIKGEGQAKNIKVIVVVIIAFTIAYMFYSWNLGQDTSSTVVAHDRGGSNTQQRGGLPTNQEASPDWGDILGRLEYLYKTYGEDLKKAKKYAFEFAETPQMAAHVSASLPIPRVMYHDVEAEITYLRLRDWKPKHVFEMSPAFGYSTVWILLALRDNNNDATLHSFDIHDSSSDMVPPELAKGVWTLIVGNAFDTMHKPGYPEFDYYFIDSDHSYHFARVYCEKIFDKINRPVPTPISVHDIFYGPAPQSLASEEGIAVMEYLALSNRVQNVFTTSIGKEVWFREQLNLIRTSVGIDINVRTKTDIDYNAVDPSIFFEIKAASNIKDRTRPRVPPAVYLDCGDRGYCKINDLTLGCC